MACASNQHQHVYAVTMYAQDSKGRFPRNASECTRNNGTSSWWIDTVIANYAGPTGGRDPYDLRPLMKKYIGGQVEVFSCPSNGGPRMDDQANVTYVAQNGYMGAQVMMFWNSVGVFKGTKPANAQGPEVPWAPKPDWMEGGLPAGVPLVEDELAAIGGTVITPDHYYYNHGRSASRSNFNSTPVYTNYKVSPNRSDITGVNVSRSNV